MGFRGLQRVFNDYYLIARCFRSYDKKEGYSRPSYNNIIYVGGYHGRTYLKILRKIGFNVDVSVPKNLESVKDSSLKVKRGGTAQCLNISTLQQPLFRQRYS